MSNGKFPHYPGSKKEGKILTFPKTSKAAADAEASEVKEIMEETLQKTAVAKKFYEMEDFLEALEGTWTAHVDLKKHLLVVMSNSQLLDLVENSGETEWFNHPSYYKALSELIRERGVPLLPE